MFIRNVYIYIYIYICMSDCLKWHIYIKTFLLSEMIKMFLVRIEGFRLGKLFIMEVWTSIYVLLNKNAVIHLLKKGGSFKVTEVSPTVTASLVA
uniref:Uncharacterized protein n=1 Tax=Parascaris univalens TaxID=6257 RepID=A0A915AT60_PARUN